MSAGLILRDGTGAILRDSAGAVLRPYGLLVTLEATTGADVAAFSGYGVPPVAVTLAAQAGDDAAVITGLHPTAIEATLAAALEPVTATVAGQFIAPTTGALDAQAGSDTADLSLAVQIDATLNLSLDAITPTLAGEHYQGVFFNFSTARRLSADTTTLSWAPGGTLTGARADIRLQHLNALCLAATLAGDATTIVARVGLESAHRARWGLLVGADLRTSWSAPTAPATHRTGWGDYSTIAAGHRSGWSDYPSATLDHRAHWGGARSVTAGHEARWSDYPAARTTQRSSWSVASPTGAAHGVSWSDYPAARHVHRTGWGTAGAVTAVHAGGWADYPSAAAHHATGWAQRTTTGGGHRLRWDLSARHSAQGAHRARWTLLADVALISIENVPTIHWQGERLSVASARLSADEDSPVWIAEAIELVDRAAWSRLAIGDPITFAVGDETWNLRIDGKAFDRAMGAESLSISAVSPLAWLDAPYAGAITLETREPQSARALVAALVAEVGELDWQLPDWLIPAGALAITEATPLSAARTIVGAIGGLLESRPDGTPMARARHPVSPPDYATATPDQDWSDSEVFGSVQRAAPSAGFDRVLISNQELRGESGRDRLEYTPDDGSDYSGTVRAWPEPWRAVVLGHTGHPETTITARGEQVQTLTELVEFVGGEASVRYPVERLVSVAWQHVDLGVVAVNGQTLLAADPAESLAWITYITRSVDWAVGLDRTEAVQFVLI